MPRVALQGQALQVFHGDEGLLLEPTEPIVVQVKDFDQAEIGKRLTAQPHQPTVRKVDNTKMWKLRKLVTVQGPEIRSTQLRQNDCTLHRVHTHLTL